MQLRDRIKELRRVPASELVPNPENWRTHDDQQKSVLKSLLDDIGMASAVLARELPDGRLMLIDGHLRAETAGDELTPVLVLDVDENEAKKILLTLDPLAAMAGADKVKLDSILREVETQAPAVEEMLADLADSFGLYKEEKKKKDKPAAKISVGKIRWSVNKEKFDRWLADTTRAAGGEENLPAEFCRRLGIPESDLTEDTR